MDMLTSLMCGGEPYNSPEAAWDDEFDPMEEVLRELRHAAKHLSDKELKEEYGKAEDSGQLFWTAVLADEISWRNGVKKAECSDCEEDFLQDDLPV